jgi:hypothetical protein
VNSLESFKYSIFESVIKKDLIGTAPSLETVKSNMLDHSEKFGRKAIAGISQIPFLKKFTSYSILDSISFFSINHTLICIDDLERKGDGLTIKDVLGLISNLKDQRKCKVVLLINDGEDGLDEYRKFREKVVDIEIEFAPTPAESALIAYDGSLIFHEQLRQLTEKLGIKNIRILKKIEKLICLALPYARGCDEEIEYQFIHSITLFAWCYFNDGQDSPSLEFVTNLGYSFQGIGESKTDTVEQKKWKKLLSIYDYNQTDELDLVLAEGVRTGYFVETKLNMAVDEKNKFFLASKANDSFHKAWQLYHCNFSNNQTDVIETIYSSFKSNVNYISPSNLNGTVRLFKSLNETAKATELIDFYIESREAEKDLFDLEQNNFFGDVTDPEVKTRFNDQFLKLAKTETLEQVLNKLSRRTGWSKEDEAVLSSATVDDYYNLFKSLEDRSLPSYIRTSLGFGEFANATSTQLAIANNAREALVRIGEESLINQIRVSSYGINIE